MTDNFFKGCPPRMDDGRFITDYRPADTVNLRIMALNGIHRDDDYRMFLQKNASQIMDNQWRVTRQTQSCHTNACIHNYPTRSTNRMNYEELKTYNAVRSRQAPPPPCRNLPDYRSTETNTYFQC